MKDKPENQPAFPISEEETDRIDEGVKIYSGLTKKEYLIGQILSGDIGALANTGDPIICAKVAINLAEKVLNMLAERSKSNE